MKKLLTNLLKKLRGLLSIFLNVKTRYKVIKGIELHERLIKECQAERARNVKNPERCATFFAIEIVYQRNLEILKELL